SAFVELGEASRRAPVAAVADLAARHRLLLVVLALVAAAVAFLAPILLAAVDDDLNVRIVLVVVDELVVQLVRQRLRDDAVDHRGEPTSTFSRPFSSALAFHSRKGSSSSDSSSPFSSRMIGSCSSPRSTR